MSSFIFVIPYVSSNLYIGARFYDTIDESNIRNDILEADLAKDIESTRLFRYTFLSEPLLETTWKFVRDKIYYISILIYSFHVHRLLTKLCTVVDRADLNGDASWSEYGDRYMLKLFRDYIFHQVCLLLIFDAYLL